MRLRKQHTLFALRHVVLAAVAVIASAGVAIGLENPAAAPEKRGFGSLSIEGESGLVAMGARHYDPATGSFLQTDPLGAAADQLYAYGAGNPYLYWDPTGLAPQSIIAGEDFDASGPPRWYEADDPLEAFDNYFDRVLWSFLNSGPRFGAFVSGEMTAYDSVAYGVTEIVGIRGAYNMLRHGLTSLARRSAAALRPSTSPGIPPPEGVRLVGPDGQSSFLPASTQLNRIEPADVRTPMQPHYSPFFYAPDFAARGLDETQEYLTLYTATNDALPALRHLFSFKQAFYKVPMTVRATTVGEVTRVHPDARFFVDDVWNRDFLTTGGVLVTVPRLR